MCSQRRETCAQIIHRKWTGNVHDGYDIAMLILNESSTKPPIKINRGVRLLARLQIITIGFGAQEGSILSSVLQKITVEFIPNYNCAKIPVLRDILTKNMLCAKAGANRGPCQGWCWGLIESKSSEHCPEVPCSCFVFCCCIWIACQCLWWQCDHSVAVGGFDDIELWNTWNSFFDKQQSLSFGVEHPSSSWSESKPWPTKMN